MKTVKPQKLSVLVSPFEAGGKLRLCITTMLAAPIDAPESPLHEATLWRLLSRHLGRDVPPDLCKPKPRGEVVVMGSAYPRNPPQIGCSVRLTLGKIDKTLWVVGDRTWGLTGAMSNPVPFTSMPVSWANAFGGAGFADNPVGKGVAPIMIDGTDFHPLPNVENPKKLVKLRGDRPEPVGFGPLDLMWPERYSKVGTYDDAWLKNVYPGLPLDFNFEFYNTAPRDQRLDGHFKGDETFTIENMHATRHLIEGRLPNFIPRTFVNLQSGEFREVPMRMDTLQLFPEALTMVVLYRGVTDIAEDDASDVLHLVAACDAPEVVRSASHFKAVLDERLDMKRAGEAALRQADLMPPGPAADVRFDELADPALLATPEGLRGDAFRRRMQRELDAQRSRIAASGNDPDRFLPKGLPPREKVRPATLGEAESLRRNGKERLAKMKAEVTEAAATARARVSTTLQAAGRDLEAVLPESKGRTAGPPKVPAATQIARFRDLLKSGRLDPESARALEEKLAASQLEEGLRRAESRLNEMYRRHAHLMNPAHSGDSESSDRARTELPRGAQGGVSFAERDLTGVDLHGLDLRSIQLTRAFLEGVDLSGSDLRGADLSAAVLARAKLDGADLTGAKLAGANLGKASLVGAKLDGEIDMTGAVLVGADLTKASLRSAKLDRVDMSEAQLGDADLSGVSGEQVTFNKSDLRGAKFAGVKLFKGKFLQVDATRADFSGADLTATTFLDSKVDGANFGGARLEKLRAVRGTTFEGASFLGARLVRANLRGLKLTKCDFRGAEMDSADLSECDLQEANFYRAVARGARFMKADLRRANLTSANLMRTLMNRANLRSANLTGANLFRADLCHADVDRGTVTQDAHLKQMRFVQKRPEGQTGGGLRRGQFEPR